jgi:hypothetical protein
VLPSHDPPASSLLKIYVATATESNGQGSLSCGRNCSF